MQINGLNATSDIKKTSFGGFKDAKKSNGTDCFRFYAPPYDKKLYNISLEVVPLKQEGSEWIFDDDQIVELDLSSKKLNEDGVCYVSKDFIKKIAGEDIGYRYKLTTKSDNKTDSFLYDAGVKTGGKNPFNVISKNHGYSGNYGGPIYHMFINSFAPSEKAKNEMVTRTHFNDAGGNINGVIDKLKNTDVLDSYSLILSTPIFGADNISTHGYWSNNPYQLSNKAGNIQDFKVLQETLFDKGMGWIADGAFTSHGYMSPQLQDVMRWGEQSPFYNWYKHSGNSSIKFGVLPEGVFLNDNYYKAANNCAYKIVEKKNKDGNKAYFIQFYDTRLASKEQKTNNELFDTYDILNTKDAYEIKNNGDSTQPYWFPLANIGKDKLKVLKENEGRALASIDSPTVLDFNNFGITTKEGAKNANFWSGNVDLVKMNLTNPKNAIQEVGSIQARNYAYGAAKYWTRTASDTMLNHIAQRISKEGLENTLEDISKTYDIDLKETQKFVDKGIYINSFVDEANKKDFLMQEILNFPLSSLNLPTDVTSVLTSPFISTYPIVKEDEAKSPYELLKYEDEDGSTNYESYYNKLYFANPEINNNIKSYAKVNAKMLSVYKDSIMPFVVDVLKGVENETGNPIFNDDDSLTTYGLYVAKLSVPDILRYVFTNAIVKDGCTFNGGEAIVNKNAIDSECFETIFGNSSDSPSESANLVLDKIKGAFSNNTISKDDASNIANSLSKRFKGITEDNFKLSQAILDQTEAGLNWRFDAAKDIGDLDSVNANNLDFETYFDETIDFWKNFISSIKGENKAAYTIAEVTDLWSIFDRCNHRFGKYKNPDVAERMFLEQTGVSTDTNYSHAFSQIPMFFGQTAENADDSATKNLGALKHRLEQYLAYGPLPLITTSHIALNNHDKPRPIHNLSLNNKIFLNKDNEAFKNKAKEFFGEDIDPDMINPKSVALYEIYSKNIEKVIKNNNVKNTVLECAKYLSLGKTSNNSKISIARADAFCSDDFEITLNQIFKAAESKLREQGDIAEANELKDNSKEYIDKILENILEIPMERYSQMWEMMATLFGHPTLYSGDEYAQTGFEYPSGNVSVKNRGIVRHEILKNPNRNGTIEYNRKLNAISNLHKKPGLSALAGGTPISLPQGNNNTVWAVYKNDDKKSEVITLYSSVALKDGWDKKQDEDNHLSIDGIKLDYSEEHNDFIGGMHSGVTEGDVYSRLVYNKEKGIYEDEGENYVVTLKNGEYKLVKENGKDIDINSTTTIFYKVKDGSFED